MPKVTYKLRLDELIDTTGISVEDKDAIKEEIGSFLIDLILKDTANETSAVTGKRWKGLKPDYKKIKEKFGEAIANLELNGDMLDALEFKTYRDGIEIGFFDPEQALKAENHNKSTARSLNTALPKRQTIPNDGETFRAGIIKELTLLAREIIGEHENQ